MRKVCKPCLKDASYEIPLYLDYNGSREEELSIYFPKKAYVK